MRATLRIAVWQLRRRLGDLVGVAVLVAVAGGLSLGAFAGAERTWSAMDRMIDDTESPDVIVNPDSGGATALDPAELRDLPMVEDVSVANATLVATDDVIESVAEMDRQPLVMASDGGLLYRFGRPVVSEGRIPAQDAADEIFVERSAAAAEGIEVGDELRWRILGPTQLEAMFSATSEEEVLAVVNDPDQGTATQVQVVGIGNMADGVAFDEGFEPLPIWASPAFHEAAGSPPPAFVGMAVRLRDGGSVDEFREAADALVPDETLVYQTSDHIQRSAERAIGPSGSALAIFGVVTALVGLLLVGQATSRWLQLISSDNDVLAVLGVTRGERFVASMAAVCLTALVGGLGAMALAYSSSALTPIGQARWAETTPGLVFDPATMVIGAVLVAMSVVAVALVPAWRAARRRVRVVSRRGSRVAAWLGRVGCSAPVTVGVRFGLEPGRGTSAVPTRATIAAAATAVAVLAGTVVFAASLDRVVEDPRFYGSNFDATVEYWGNGAFTDEANIATVLATLESDPATERAGAVLIRELELDGEHVTSLSFVGGDDAVKPTIAEGRAPVAPGEIALGAATMADLGVDVGTTVAVVSPEFTGDAEVVGRAVLPGMGLYQAADRTALGTGAVTPPGPSGEAAGAFNIQFVVDLAHDADATGFEERMDAALPDFAATDEDLLGFTISMTPAAPADIQALERLRTIPVVLALALVGLVGASVALALAGAVRRRRRDLALLRALGTTRAGVRAVGLWQGLTVGVAALLLGVPVGLVLGRRIWILLAQAFGTFAEPVVPAVALVVVAALVLSTVAVASLLPTRGSTRTAPAEVLRHD